MTTDGPLPSQSWPGALRAQFAQCDRGATTRAMARRLPGAGDA
jgi:hypothetical protein